MLILKSEVQNKRSNMGQLIQEVDHYNWSFSNGELENIDPIFPPPSFIQE